jgi:hypothetical protein
MNRSAIRTSGRTAVLALCSAALLLLTLSGCGGTATSAGSQSGIPAAKTTADTKTLTFDPVASQTGRPRKAAESTLTAPWFPPPGVNGIAPLVNADYISKLTYAISGNQQFWIARPTDKNRPLSFGTDAASLLATSTGFSVGAIVPVRRVDPALVASGTTPTDPVKAIEPSPTGYQVALKGDVGLTSFGVRPNAKAGDWLLDPNGELVNWAAALETVKAAGMTPTGAYITRTAFALEGKPVLYLSWGVFEDKATGKALAVALHQPPAIAATWGIGGQQLKMGAAYDPATIFKPVTVTPVAAPQ